MLHTTDLLVACAAVGSALFMESHSGTTDKTPGVMFLESNVTRDSSCWKGVRPPLTQSLTVLVLIVLPTIPQAFLGQKFLKAHRQKVNQAVLTQSRSCGSRTVTVIGMTGPGSLGIAAQ